MGLPSPVVSPKDFQALCLSCELAMAEEVAEAYELPELPQVIFYVILLNEAERLGILQGRVLRMLSTFESCVWLYGDRISKLGSRQRLNRRKVQGPVNRKRARRWSRRVRDRPPRGQPPLLTMISRDGYMVEMNWPLGSWEYLPVPQLSYAPSINTTSYFYT
ncbi:hypothetical protein Cgig2_014164 [Carnegiea gigantea]|uniref:Uncharacterized protein n=1 Tax=Carnegiea gigantea TaxID=171969 RepID=A0A9Q1Q5Z2_9CARY|nr:hypothetical protein Cgig2_014164 [Carnegiea gigantea]